MRLKGEMKRAIFLRKLSGQRSESPGESQLREGAKAYDLKCLTSQGRWPVCIGSGPILRVPEEIAHRRNG